MTATAELYFSHSPEPVADGALDQESPYLQSPSYQIPLLWLALFDATDVLDGAQATAYAVNNKRRALERLGKVVPELLRVTPHLRADWVAAFLQFVDSAPFAFVHMETRELADMAGSPDAWRDSLREMLRSLDNPATVEALVEQAVSEASQNRYWSYCGSSVGDPAPWER